MRANLAFQRTLLSLSHPITISAILLLLFNDHIWRRIAPSWITGKIGDFAWLIFAPFLLAAILAWLIPFRIQRRDAVIGYGAILSTGLIFALVKTVPAFHARFADLFKGVMGWTPATLLDPTDLLTMPALLIAWLIWQRSTVSFAFLSRRGWLTLSIGAFATIANVSPSIDLGVICLVEKDSRITAISYANNSPNQLFSSDDGGLTWREASPRDAECRDPYRGSRRTDPVGAPFQISDPTNNLIQYRVTRGHSVERSDNGGQTWMDEIELGGEEARLTFLDRLWTMPVGPWDVLLHQPTGNLVMAMGLEGVLVRTDRGEWHWLSVGKYSAPDLRRIDRITSLLANEIWLSVGLIGLILSTISIRVDKRRINVSNLIKAFLLALTLAASIYGGVLIMDMHPTLEIELIAVTIVIGLLIAIVKLAYRPSLKEVLPIAMCIVAWSALAIPLLWSVVVLGVLVGIYYGRLLFSRSHRALLLALSIAIAGTVLYLSPYVLWTQGTIPSFDTAKVSALALTAATVIAGRFCMKRYLERSDELASETNSTIGNLSGGAL